MCYYIFFQHVFEARGTQNMEVPLSNLFLLIYRYIVDAEMVDISILSGQWMTVLGIIHIEHCCEYE